MSGGAASGFERRGGVLVCDGCSLGPYGLRDNVLDGVHLCMTRLKLMRQNTMGAVDLASLSDVRRLRGMEPQRLRSLGRIAYPMIRRKGQRGFLRISWGEALDMYRKVMLVHGDSKQASDTAFRGFTDDDWKQLEEAWKAWVSGPKFMNGQ